MQRNLGKPESSKKSTQLFNLPSAPTNMPATTVEEWLQSERPDDPPHRCKRIIREWATEDGAFVTCCADDGTKQTHKLVAMSSLSRRACYKCGNVGHYAEVCSSAERLCYNCKSNLRAPIWLQEYPTDPLLIGKQPGRHPLAIYLELL